MHSYIDHCQYYARLAVLQLFPEVPKTAGTNVPDDEDSLEEEDSSDADSSDDSSELDVSSWVAAGWMAGARAGVGVGAAAMASSTAGFFVGFVCCGWLVALRFAAPGGRICGVIGARCTLMQSPSRISSTGLDGSTANPSMHSCKLFGPVMLKSLLMAAASSPIEPRLLGGAYLSQGQHASVDTAS